MINRIEMIEIRNNVIAVEVIKFITYFSIFPTASMPRLPNTVFVHYNTLKKKIIFYIRNILIQEIFYEASVQGFSKTLDFAFRLQTVIISCTNVSSPFTSIIAQTGDFFCFLQIFRCRIYRHCHS